MRLSPGRRALLAGLIGWVPLALLTLVHTGWRSDLAISFYRDVAVHIRFLIGVPALIVAERLCLPRLKRLARHFVRAGVVCDVDEFMTVVRQTRRDIASVWTRVSIVVAAYALTSIFVRGDSIAVLPAWNRGDAGPHGLSTAGLWHAVVSVPLLIGLVLAWFWRLFRWAQFLGRVARLELRLIAGHPDRRAGLGFLAESLTALTPLGFALSTLIAAGAAGQIVVLGRLMPSEAYRDVGLVIFVALLFALPLFAFVPVLLRVRHHGALLYGTLGQHIGRAFEARWIRVPTIDSDHALEATDFSATIDASSIIQIGLSVGLLPFGLPDFLLLVVAMLLPFVPIVMMAVPAEQLWAAAKNLVL